MLKKNLILVAMLIVNSSANATQIEIAFNGGIEYLFHQNETYNPSLPFVPSDILDATYFQGIISYDSTAVPSAGFAMTAYEPATLTLTIDDDFTLTGSGYIGVRSDNPNYSDMVRFSFGGLEANFINQAPEMTSLATSFNLTMRGDTSAFGATGMPPTSADLLLLTPSHASLDFYSAAETYMPCPNCLDGEDSIFYSTQEYSFTSSFVAVARISEVPLPAGGWLLMVSLAGLLGKKCRLAS